MTITAPAVGAQLATDQIGETHWPFTKLAFGVEDSASLVSEEDPLPISDAAVLEALAGTLDVLPIISPWTTWAPGAAIDMRNYAGVEIQVTAAATATFTRSGDGNTYATINSTSGGVATAAAAPGFYNLKGGGFLKWAGTGTILVRGYN